MQYELYHHGILGMKWGIRRFQNKDGTLTAAGKKRYRSSDVAEVDKKLQEISAKNKAMLASIGNSDLYYKNQNDRRAIANSMLEIVGRNYPEYKRKIDERDNLLREFDPWVSAHESGEKWARMKSTENKMRSVLSRIQVLDEEIESMSKAIAEEFLGKVGNEKISGVFGNKVAKGEEFARHLAGRNW